MILPFKKLKGFLYFEESFWQGNNDNYEFVVIDTIKVHREITKKFLWFNKTKEIIDVYKFNRKSIEKEDGSYWEQTTSCFELINQLKQIEKSNWKYIDSNSYKIIKETFPELII